MQKIKPTKADIKREGEANKLAMEILIPKEEMDYAIFKGLTVDQMAEKFNVPMTVAAARMMQCGYTPHEYVGILQLVDDE